jgi:DMSO/TMAO reductase YedYZ molybdopterin-dependent catalytic subunit
VRDIRDSLPVHAGRGPSHRGAGPTLRIDGLVRRPWDAPAADLEGLPRTVHAEPFTCEEGWTVPEISWRGVRLTDVIGLAGPLPSARYVRVHAGDFVVPVPLDGAARALLCDEMNGRPLTAAHGAPWRLLVPGGQCFTSVKWVDRLELSADPGANDGERIARARLRSSAGKPARRQ